MTTFITQLIQNGSYLLELERCGYIDSGSEKKQVGNSKGGGQFTSEFRQQLEGEATS